jgi:hypothetical protein
MNILLQIPEKEFFTFRKEKKGWHVRSGQKPKYVAVQEFFQKFLRLKGDFKKPEGKVFLREFDQGTFEFGPRGKFSNLPNLKLGILDLCDAPGHLDKEDTTRSPYFLWFIQCLSLQLNPGLHDPPVWIWITKTSEHHAHVIHYVEGHMKDYKLTSAHYVIHPNERLYAREPKGKTKPQEVFLVFLQEERYGTCTCGISLCNTTHRLLYIAA